MSSGRKCKNCGSLDIEVDPARGDAVCTNCGSVLEDNIIVAEVQFEENAHGTSNTIGQFVSADSKGGPTNFGASFHVGIGVESREVTLRKSRNGIANLCNQLRLNQHCIDTACNFFKMALARNLTRGRRNTHMYGACVYITCRTEGTPHMLIDISDVLQICCYELGRTYLRISQELSIHVPSLDPCLYILRFAAKLEFGSKTQEVANTALRLVQRMKKDMIHYGRRPAGLCGAALLIAARLHEFNRTEGDIVKIVKVHESTLRKRLLEFGETPSSALTLEEFMTVDLEEEQDPPSFKVARKKDKDRLQKLLDEEPNQITDLQKEIEFLLEQCSRRKRRKVNIDADEEHDANRFITESIDGTIQKILEEDVDNPSTENSDDKELGPNIASMGLAMSLDDTASVPLNTPTTQIDLTFDDIDDDEIDNYIMTKSEVNNKNLLWNKFNADYLEQQKVKEERLAKEKAEGKPEKRKRRNVRKKQNTGPASSAGEAIEKMLQEKKVSSKINYDVLKSLSATKSEKTSEKPSQNTYNEFERRRSISTSSSVDLPPTKKSRNAPNLRKTKMKDQPFIGLPLVEDEKTITKAEEAEEVPPDEEDFEDECEEHADPEMGVLQMLRQHQQIEDDEAESIFGAGLGDEDY